MRRVILYTQINGQQQYDSKSCCQSSESSSCSSTNDLVYSFEMERGHENTHIIGASASKR